MTTKNLTAIPPDESEDDGFGVLQHRLLSANERLKLAADKLSDYDALPEDHVPAAFVVEEATLALAQIHEDYDMWYMERKHTPKAKEVQS